MYPDINNVCFATDEKGRTHFIWRHKNGHQWKLRYATSDDGGRTIEVKSQEESDRLLLAAIEEVIEKEPWLAGI